jgi:capsular exopolysaccharide synthesis family protein
VRQFLKLFPKREDETVSAAASLTAEISAGIDKALDLRIACVEQVKIDEGCRLVFHTDPRSAAADRFRHLRMRLREPWETGKLKSILITSALPEDGKSTVAVNLASALCERGRRKVLLIEADLHRPSLTSMLGLEAGGGLAECLGAGQNPMSLIRRLEPLGWYLLPAGGECGNPTDLLQAAGLSGLLLRLAAHFDWILIDSPPVIPVTDAIALVRDVDALLMVVRAASTPRDAVQRSLDLLGRKKLLAVVLNGLESLDRIYSRYGYYGNYRTDATETRSNLSSVR